MEWFWVLPVVVLAGLAAGWIRYLHTSRRSYYGEELGPIFAGLVSAGLAFALCLFGSWIASGVSLSLVMLVFLVLVLLFASAITIGGAMAGAFGIVVIGSLLVAAIGSTIGSEQVTGLTNERAALASEATERVYNLDCEGVEGSRLIVVGRKRETDFQVLGYRYRITSDDNSGQGAGELSIEISRGRYRNVLAFESDLVANDEWQSRQVSAPTYLGSDQVEINLTARYPGRTAYCFVPAAF